MEWRCGALPTGLALLHFQCLPIVRSLEAQSTTWWISEPAIIIFNITKITYGYFSELRIHARAWFGGLLRLGIHSIFKYERKMIKHPLSIFQLLFRKSVKAFLVKMKPPLIYCGKIVVHTRDKRVIKMKYSFWKWHRHEIQVQSKICA